MSLLAESHKQQMCCFIPWYDHPSTHPWILCSFREQVKCYVFKCIQRPEEADGSWALVRWKRQILTKRPCWDHGDLREDFWEYTLPRARRQRMSVWTGTMTQIVWPCGSILYLTKMSEENSEIRKITFTLITPSLEVSWRLLKFHLAYKKSTFILAWTDTEG